MSRMERKLSAILAADVAGYSRLMEADEERHAFPADLAPAERAGSMHRRAPRHASSKPPATGCSRSLRARSTPFDRRWKFKPKWPAATPRRLSPEGSCSASASMSATSWSRTATSSAMGSTSRRGWKAPADPGGICVSARVQEDVAGKIDLVFDDMGEQSLKNITRPVRAFRLQLDRPARADGETRLASPGKPSIAVLPFQNLSGQPDQDYFGDGISEDIITALSKLRGFFVIARNSTFAYKGKTPDIRQVARELGVRYVLEGSVRKSGEQLRGHRPAHRRCQRQSHLGRALRPAGFRDICSSG